MRNANEGRDGRSEVCASVLHNVVSGAGDITPATGKDIQGADQPVTVTGVEAGSHPGDTLTGGLNIGTADPKSVVLGKRADLGGRRYLKKKNGRKGQRVGNPST